MNKSRFLLTVYLKSTGPKGANFVQLDTAKDKLDFRILSKKSTF